MNIKTLTDKDLDNIFISYARIAFNSEPTYSPMLEELQSKDGIIYPGAINDGYRLGISGWPHTKLKINVESDGRLRFGIYPNGDEFTKAQKLILVRLKKWAEGISK